VVLSRTVQELERPALVIREALRVGKNLAIGFVNYGYWRNRLSSLLTGSLPINEVFPNPWYDDRPHNPVTVNGFETFCEREGFTIRHRTYLRGDWRTHLTRWPGIRAGYALYAVEGAKQ
jgi:methionine biosynthesis protein MetW